jgi:hypothetical protein
MLGSKEPVSPNAGRLGQGGPDSIAAARSVTRAATWDHRVRGGLRIESVAAAIEATRPDEAVRPQVLECTRSVCASCRRDRA